jgi:hypothetical protein
MEKSFLSFLFVLYWSKKGAWEGSSHFLESVYNILVLFDGVGEMYNKLSDEEKIKLPIPLSFIP